MEIKAQPHYIGHRQRLRDKAKTIGLKNMPEYEILEYMLTFTLPRIDTKETAKKLIENFGSLKQVLDAKEEDLIKFKGIKGQTISFIGFLKEYAALYPYLNIRQKDILISPSAVYQYLISLLSGEDIEKVYLLLLNSSNHIFANKELEIGTVNKSYIIPRKIIQTSLKENAAAAILAHNHPGGNLKPSQNDLDATKELKRGFELVDIVLLDHIIVSGKEYFSFKEYGLI
ncbi:MAG: DNA repair protein RadC [Elusimicrobiota bacterium]|jgi:DNA repair protein RadC|nr:DNA repair protein RadC [Elusimicrobiota bacterium]